MTFNSGNQLSLIKSLAIIALPAILITVILSIIILQPVRIIS
ncbi:unnamed protein product [Fructobacillus evanidus]|uniref:Uncharacterized protein n=1 Tax=Fructobacillus evanidus TaxID=3064281 RepID=A0ABN9YW66_9LACO|nr:unnamed protein product [Fructobacillus sp. LMG 32999]CAK1238418.1 unnamed protein product [Fructobacillus sp. LMG 32999]CAK1240379.1 unnamed protein product [Fructobacillus sp. LMG 32999]CAK1244305.1 unnamed protein product [Fructobacillus sp. LMG 32999]CAK1244604.1 unnamed protein product [Fructobacillus sp. LMG 32999]